MSKILILGGGLSGLSCAYFASRAGHRITVLEAGNKMGGLLDTFEIGNNRLEKFYHHFFTHDTELLWLINELGISDKLKYYNGSMGIFSKEKIYDFNGPSDLLKMDCLNVGDKIRFGLTSIYLAKFADWKDRENSPIYDWFLRYAGKDVTELIWEPLLKSKFGSYYREVPLAWMIGRLSQRIGSRKRGKERLGYLQGSTDVLLKTLIERLQNQNAELITNAKVTEFIMEGQKVIGVETSNGPYLADSILATIPANTLSHLIRKVNSSYADKLSQIEYFGAMCLIYELSQPLSSIYWLNVAKKNFSFGGVIEHTNLVPSDQYLGKHIVYLSRYFGQQEEITGLGEQEIERIMFADLQKIYPKFDRSSIVNTYFFRTNTAATVCDLNFSQKIPNCKTPIENLFIVNMAHVYPDERSCNNSIRTAAKACNVMGIDTSYVPNGRSLAGLIGMD